MALKLKISRTFGERITPSESKEIKSIYLISIVGEGKSEEQYFCGLRDYLTESGNNYILKIEVLEKASDYEHKSHPNHLFELLEERAKSWEEWGIESSELWMIIDRDSQDRSAKQLQDIVTACNEKSYHIALTNPAFELWLLLHLTNLRLRK